MDSWLANGEGLFRGHLLCVMAKDPNEDMYPLAYAVVKVEQRYSWTWFIELFMHDTMSEDERPWTWIFNRQKVFELMSYIIFAHHVCFFVG